MTQTSIRDTLKKLRIYLSNYDDTKELTTGKHDIWSLKKILVLHDYIKPYLQIIRNNKYKKVHYIDPFSGSGFMKIKGKLMPGTPLIPLLHTRELIQENNSWYFNSVYFSDVKKRSLNALEKRTMDLKNNLPTTHKIERNSFDTVVSIFFKGVPPIPKKIKDDAYLVVLDPYGYDVEWSLLEQILKSGPVDVILTLPSELANWTKTMSPSKNKLVKLYGSDEILEFESGEEIVKKYCEKIRNIPMKWHMKTSYITVGANKQSYHLVCISRSNGALNVFSSMQKKFDGISTKDLEAIFHDAVDEGLTAFF